MVQQESPDLPDDVIDTCAPNADANRLFCGANAEYRVLDARASVRSDAPDVIQKLRILADLCRHPERHPVLWS